MSDLVQQLRDESVTWRPSPLTELSDQAASRIESLQQTIWQMHSEAHEHIKRIELLEENIKTEQVLREQQHALVERYAHWNRRLVAALQAIAGLPVGNKARVIASCALEDAGE